MKKILFTLSAVIILSAANAQTKKVETWPNGNKRSEGIVLGDAKVDANATKEEKARAAVNIAKDGKWSTWFESGKVRSEEYYSNGAMTGAWKVWYESGQLESDIDFTTGKAAYFYKSGKKNSEGGIASGMISTGKWVAYFENEIKITKELIQVTDKKMEFGPGMMKWDRLQMFRPIQKEIC
jgi:antitoxin component YwqK of YwqJK toxin-antitoxin module